MAGWVLAIDFGTSYTTVAIAERGRVELIDVDGVRAMPSGVWHDGVGALVVGTAAERQARLAPERWERAPKRLLGEVAPLLLGGFEVSVVEAVAAVLRHAAAEAMRRQGGPPDEVRLTCPARWGDRRRGGLQAAAGIAGLGIPVVARPPRLVPEPVAAALYFADRGQLPGGAQVAVYDLGGGTFDTTVLAADNTGFAVRGLGGLDGTGGESFDGLVYSYVGRQIAGRDPKVWESLQAPPDARWRRAGADLYREARRAKEDLSRYPSVTLDTEALVGVQLQLTRGELESVLRPRIEATARELADTISRTGQRPEQMAAVYLAGGCSRMPLVERVVSDTLQVSVSVLGEPKSVVAAGAARWTVGVRVEGSPAPAPQRSPDPPPYQRRDAAPDTAADVRTRIVPAPSDRSWAPPPPPDRTWAPPPPDQTWTPPSPGQTWAPAPRPAGTRTWSRHPATIIAAVAILLVGVGTGIFLIARRQNPPAKPVPLAAPGHLSGMATANGVRLTWDAVPNADHYEITRDGDFHVGTSTTTSTTFTPADLESHSYFVQAVDRHGAAGKRSAIVNVRFTLTAGQQALVARLPDDLVDAATCKPNTEIDPRNTTAAVSCGLASTQAAPSPPAVPPALVYAYQHRDAQGLQQHLDSWYANIPFKGTQCTSPPAKAPWNYEDDAEGVVRGTYYCYLNNDAAHFDWTYTGETILLATVLSGTNAESLHLWWLPTPIALKPK